MKAASVMAAGLAAMLWVSVSGAAQPEPAPAYPTKPIRFICPYNPGGAGDIFTRTVAMKLTEYLGQNVVVDNRAGANGGIGTAIVAKAAPDGYTILMGNSGPMTVNPNLYHRVAYDPLKDLQPISQGTVYWYVLVVLPSAPTQSLSGLIETLKAKPGQLTYGSTGVGGGNHLAGELFNVMTKTKAIHVPYTGSALALASLLGAQTNYMFDTVVTAVPHIRSARLRAFAVTAMKRSQALPEVPTMDEAGLKGYEITQWQAVVAPGGTPRAIVDRLNEAVVRALKSPDVVERIGPRAGNELVGNTPDEFAEVIKRDLDKYAKLIRAAGIQRQ